MRVKEIGLRQKTPSKHQPTSQNGEFKVENGLQTSFGDSRVAPSLKHRAYLWKWRNKEIEIKTLSNFRGAEKKIQKTDCGNVALTLGMSDVRESWKVGCTVCGAGVRQYNGRE